MLMKKVFFLVVGLYFLHVGSPEAQTFAPQNTLAATPAVSETKAAAKKKTYGEESNSMNVVKNLQAAEPTEENKYDNNQRKVYTLKFTDGDVVVDDETPRSILISYGNYQIHKSFDSMIRCSIRVYVLNDLTERITNFSAQLHWPELSTTIQMNRLNPGVKTYTDIVLLGEGCFNLDKVPTIEVNRCRVKGMTQEQCADAVVWFQGQK